MPSPVAKSYRQWIQALVPPWLQTPGAAAYLGSFGYVKDLLLAQAKLGIKQRCPSFAAVDALAQIGVDRGIAEGPLDTPQSYAARLKNAWNLWQWAGSAFGLLTALSTAGYSNVLIVQQNGFIFSLNGQGKLVQTPLVTYGAGGPFNLPQWLFDVGQPATVGAQLQPGATGGPPSQPTGDAVVTDGPYPPDRAGWPQNRRWARYAVLFPQPLPAGAPPLPDWTNVTTPLSSATSPSQGEVDNIRRLIQQWGPGDAICTGIIAVKSGQCWGWPQETFNFDPTWNAWWNSSSVEWSANVGSPT